MKHWLFLLWAMMAPIPPAQAATWWPWGQNKTAQGSAALLGTQPGTSGQDLARTVAPPGTWAAPRTFSEFSVEQQAYMTANQTMVMTAKTQMQRAQEAVKTAYQKRLADLAAMPAPMVAPPPTQARSSTPQPVKGAAAISPATRPPVSPQPSVPSSGVAPPARPSIPANPQAAPAPTNPLPAGVPNIRRPQKSSTPEQKPQ